MKPHLSSIHLLNFSPAVEFQGKHRQAISNIIADMVAHKYLDASRKPYTPKQIRLEMALEFGISMSYQKFWKAQKVSCKSNSVLMQTHTNYCLLCHTFLKNQIWALQ
ncbi:unnamed protein product [Cuscuta europaea]|uniref:Uncharacterized protein n=1 Tax=Cuscuta europaea TaxID=41803 RepID=A0A9P0Z7Z1_CUSEU|nr:unnamed protein product [Cuscuta europaea]